MYADGCKLCCDPEVARSGHHRAIEWCDVREINTSISFISSPHSEPCYNKIY